jgi:hypothetical protein
MNRFQTASLTGIVERRQEDEDLLDRPDELPRSQRYREVSAGHGSASIWLATSTRSHGVAPLVEAGTDPPLFPSAASTPFARESDTRRLY